MNEHDQLREQMWDLVYGLAAPSETAALHARIKSDSKVARLYAEVRLEADLIAQAAKVEDASVSLPQLEPRRAQPAAGRAKETAEAPRAKIANVSQRLHWLAAFGASALAVLLGVGLFWQAEKHQPPDLVLVSVWRDDPSSLVATLPTELTIEAKHTDGKPVSGKFFKAQIADTSGKALYERLVETDEEGRALLSVPGQAVEAGSNLRILREIQQHVEPPAPTTSLPTERLAELRKTEEVLMDAPLPVQEEPLQTQVTFDKDQYEAGDVLRFRVVANSAFSRQLQDASTLAFSLQSPDGRFLEPTDALPLEGTGVVAGEFQLPADAPPGRYAFAVRGRPQSQMREDASVIVGGETGAYLQGNMLADAFARGSRDSSTALGEATGFGGGGFAAPAPGGLGGGRPDEKRENNRDLTGKNQVRMKVAKEAQPSVAGGQPAGPAVPSAAIESAATEPVPAAPAPANAPSAPKVERFRIEEEPAQSVRSDESKQFFGQVDKLAQVGKQPVKELEVLVPPELAGRPVRIEAYYQKILLGKKIAPTQDETRATLAEISPDAQHSRTAALPLEPWVDGEELELKFYDNSAPSSPPLVTQRVLTPSQFHIALSDAKDVYAPGERVRFLVEVTSKLDGLAVPKAALGVVVKPALNETWGVQQRAKAIDDRVLLAGEKEDRDGGRGETAREPDQGALRMRRKLSAAEAPATDELAKQKDVAADHPQSAPAAPHKLAPTAGDVLPPAESVPPVVQELQIEAALALKDEGKSMEYESAAAGTFSDALPPVLASNEAVVKKALDEQEAARSARQAKVALWRARLGRLLLLGGVVMLLVLAVAFAVQRPAKARVWIPSLGIVAASFAVGFVWLLGQPKHPGHEVAQRDFAGATDQAQYANSMGRAAAQSESDVAMATDSEQVNAGAALDSDSGAIPALAPGAAGPRGGAFADGSTPSSASDPRQRRFADRQDAQRPSDQPARTPKTDEPATVLEATVAPREKLPAVSGNVPSRPEADIKRDAPLAEPEKIKRNAGDDASASKPAAAPEAPEMLSAKREKAEAEKKRMQGLGKNGEATARRDLADDKGDRNEALDAKIKDVKKTANTTIWQPLLLADENGRAVIEFTMPETPGDYRLVLDVHGRGRSGQLQTKIRCEPQPAAEAAKP